MADMAEITQVEICWEQLVRTGVTNDEGDGVTPVTYINSTAAIKAFCGERGGVVCTSSNAASAMKWGFRTGTEGSTLYRKKILFLPDQHLGRNTGYAMGIPLNEMVVWDPYQLNGGTTPEQLRAAKIILWKGHCSVHQRFLPEHVENVRAKYPGIRVIVHPECRWEVCQKADGIGSTEGLLKMIRQAPSGSMFAVGTEIHLVNRMGKEFAAEGKSNYPRRFRLSVHHHVPYLAATFVLGAGKSRGRECGQPNKSEGRREVLGENGIGPDAGGSVRRRWSSSLAVTPQQPVQAFAKDQRPTANDSDAVKYPHSLCPTAPSPSKKPKCCFPSLSLSCARQ